MNLNPDVEPDRNGDYVIVAAIENRDRVNGKPTFIVTGRRQTTLEWAREIFVTWHLAFSPNDDGTHSPSYFWGHEFTGAKARERAYEDMANRVNV